MRNKEYTNFIKDYAKKNNKSYMCVISEASKEYKKLKEKKNEKKQEVKEKKQDTKDEPDLIKMLNTFKDIEKQVEIMKVATKETQSKEKRKLTALINKARSFTNNNVINQRLFNSKLKDALRQ